MKLFKRSRGWLFGVIGGLSRYIGIPATLGRLLYLFLAVSGGITLWAAIYAVLYVISED